MYSSAISGNSIRLLLLTQKDLQVHQAQEGIQTQPTQLSELAQQNQQTVQSLQSNSSLGSNINVFV